MRLIDADALKKELERYRFAVVGFEGVLFIIDKTPTETFTFEEAFQKTVCEQGIYCPKRSTGEWIFRKGDCYTYYNCSNCGAVERTKKNYCSCCGRKMLKED